MCILFSNLTTKAKGVCKGESKQSPDLIKRPMGHIAHLRKQFKSKNTYGYIITLIKRRKKTPL